MTATLRNTGSRQRKTSPSLVAGQNSLSRPCISGRPAPGIRTTNMSPAETAKSAAVAQNALVAPTTAINRPPTPGPTRYATPQIASCIPFARSSGSPAARAASGSIDSRAVIPAGSKNAPITARTARSAKLSPTSALRIGIAATLTSERRSLTTETRRRPMMSTSVPERSDVSSNGTSVIAPIAAA